MSPLPAFPDAGGRVCWSRLQKKGCDKEGCCRGIQLTIQGPWLSFIKLNFVSIPCSWASNKTTTIFLSHCSESRLYFLKSFLPFKWNGALALNWLFSRAKEWFIKTLGCLSCKKKKRKRQKSVFRVVKLSYHRRETTLVRRGHHWVLVNRIRKDSARFAELSHRIIWSWYFYCHFPKNTLTICLL